MYPKTRIFIPRAEYESKSKKHLNELVDLKAHPESVVLVLLFRLCFQARILIVLYTLIILGANQKTTSVFETTLQESNL